MKTQQFEALFDEIDSFWFYCADYGLTIYKYIKTCVYKTLDKCSGCELLISMKFI